MAFAVGALAVIVGFKRFLPKVPGAIIAVVVSIALSSALDVTQDGVAIVGDVQGGFPPIGLPTGITWSDVPAVLGVSFSCFVLIIAQSAATSRSFAQKHGQRVDVNRDILGLSAANVAAGLSGTFVVNGSPTKTQILDEQKGRTQLANITMSLVTLAVVLFLSELLTDMPKAVLGAIVFLIGIDLIDIAGLRRIWQARRSEFFIAALTGVVVFTIGVVEGIVLAVILSIVEMVRRQYRPQRFVVGVDAGGTTTYVPATPGVQSATRTSGVPLRRRPVLRQRQPVLQTTCRSWSTPRRVRSGGSCWTARPSPTSTTPPPSHWSGLIDFVHTRGAVFALAGLDPDLRSDLTRQGVLARLHADHIYPDISSAVTAYGVWAADPDNATDATNPGTEPSKQSPPAGEVTR